MPVPAGFDTLVRHITNTPIGASDLNTEIAAKNGDGYSVTDIKFADEDNAALVFVRAGDIVPTVPPQKVNLVTLSQVALDADKAAEQPDFWPTQVYITPTGASVFVLYTDFSGGS
jgi:hypothetical protein